MKLTFVSKFSFTIPTLFISMVKFALPKSIEWGFLLSVVMVLRLRLLLAKGLFGYDYKSQSAYGVAATYSNITIVDISFCLQALGPESMLPLFIIESLCSLNGHAFG